MLCHDFSHPLSSFQLVQVNTSIQHLDLTSQLKHFMHLCQEDQMRGSLFPSSLATSQLLRHVTWTPQLCSRRWGIVIQFFFTFTPCHKKQMGSPDHYFISRATRYVDRQLRATSHTRLRACYHYTLSTLIGGKGGAAPSSPHIGTLEGPTEYISECKMDVNVHGFSHGMKWTVYRGHSYYFQKPLVGGRPNIEPGDHGTHNAHNRWFILFLSCARRTRVTRISLK